VATSNKAGALWKMSMLQEAINEYCGLLSDLALAPELQVKALTNLAAVFRSRGNLFEARLHATEGLRMAETLGLKRSEAFLHRILGNLLDDLAERQADPDDRLLRESLRHQEKSRQLFVELDLAAEAAVNHVNIGALYCRMGNFIVGLKMLREGLTACEAQRNRRNVAFALKELGKTYYLSGNHQKAKDHFFDCERIADRHGYVDLLFICYFYLREIDVAAGGRGVYETKRLLRLQPLQEGSFFELQQFEQGLEELQESVG
jgi:tetratricopeptide (TPR) repeat protein